jgi:hypothetical protein
MAFAKFAIILIILSIAQKLGAVTIDDVFETYQVVKNTNNSALIKVKEESVAFMNQHAVEILTNPKALKFQLDDIQVLLRAKTFVAPEKEFFKFVSKWIPTNNPNDMDKGKVLGMVRLADIDDDTLIMDVDDSKYFTRDEIFNALKERRKNKP